MKVLWSHEAERSLNEILDYIAEDSVDHALRFISKLRKRAENLAEFPNLGRVVPELEKKDIREVIEGNYRIIYRIKAQTVEIITVFEGHRIMDQSKNSLKKKSLRKL